MLFTLLERNPCRVFEDKIKVTVVHVELFRDSAYTQPLDDWHKMPSMGLLRSPEYIFGEDDPIYVQVKNIGTENELAEFKTAAVVVKSQSSYFIYMDLKETGVDTQIFRNSDADTGELLYLSTEDSDDYPDPTTRDTIRLIDEEVLYFWLKIPPIYGVYKLSEDVMVDRAEIGVEWQKYYEACCTHGGEDIPTERFGEQLFNNIGGNPGLVWFKNFDCNNLDSQQSHWKPPGDSAYTDSVDITSWSGHTYYKQLHFFTNSGCDNLQRSDIDLGDKDADWVILDTCYSLDGTEQDLKNYFLTSGRCAHMFLGFVNIAKWTPENCGKYFADRLKEVGIKQAWFDYCQYKQPLGTIVRVFYSPYCGNESLAGPGPIEVLRDPTKDHNWVSEDYPPQD